MSKSFEKKFRAVCTHCTESTIKTYMFNVRGLAKEAGHGAVPEGHGWINDALLAKLKKGTATRYKRFTITAVKVLQAYGIKGQKLKKWQEQMRISTDKYGATRDKQKRTDREARNWPDGGYQALTGLARKLHGEVEHLFKEPPKLITTRCSATLLFYFIRSTRCAGISAMCASSGKDTTIFTGRARARGTCTWAHTRPPKATARLT